MKKHDDFLVEIHTEELPPKSILKLGEAFAQQMQERLQKADLSFEDIKFFATPRRLAVFVKDLAAQQPDQVVERKGPAVNAAFDKEGKPTPACIGFARSCGVTPEALVKSVTPQGEWMTYTQKVTGKPITEILPALVEQAVLALPVPKRMRWSDRDTQFSRPIHSVMMLYGDQVVEGSILGYPAGRETRGHRFHAPDVFTLMHAAEYEALLRNDAFVIADFESRRSEILNAAQSAVELQFRLNATAQIDHDLLDEVTGLVEYPVAIIGHFDKNFLALPSEVLISSMQDHQRYFPVVDTHHQLLPHFVTISNIKSHQPERVVHGNERVLRARLSDAAFFYETDQKHSLESRIDSLKGIVFQAGLGSLHDKAVRISKLSALIAERIGADAVQAAHAGLLAKTDLTTQMVGEFPELQGVMGCYYARQDGLPEGIASAMKEQYMPRFSGDDLPSHPIGQALALADRLDSLAGAFGINQIPTGDKDPYGLRRAALGVVRILIEKQLHLDVKEMLQVAVSQYGQLLKNADAVSQILNFIQERMRAWYQEQGITADVFAAVAALGITDPLDSHERIKAVQTFKKLNEAQALSIANKRVSNILAKYEEKITAQAIAPDYFENAAEEILAQQLEAKSSVVAKLSKSGQYDQVLLQLAELRQPVDDFFDQVMVMTDDKARRENRILLLSKLRALFLQVADIALLQ